MRGVALGTSIVALALVLTACDTTADIVPVADGPSLRIVAGDMFYEPDAVSAPAGTVEITLVNDGGTQHDLVIEDLDDLVVVDLVAPGATLTGTVDLEPGSYTFYCSVPGHRAAGMEGTLTVTD